MKYILALAQGTMLSEVRSSSEVYGTTSLLGGSIPIAGIAGDQQAALFGQVCTKPGMVKNTYGTGCFMLMNTGTKPIASKNNLLTTVAWRIGARTEYALEGRIFIAGAVVQWLRDGLEIIRETGEGPAREVTKEVSSGSTDGECVAPNGDPGRRLAATVACRAFAIARTTAVVNAANPRPAGPVRIGMTKCFLLCPSAGPAPIAARRSDATSLHSGARAKIPRTYDPIQATWPWYGRFDPARTIVRQTASKP